MAVTAAELQVVVGWDDDRMREGSKQSSNHLGGVAKSLGMAAAAAGAVAVSAIGAIGAATMSMQDALMPVGTLVGANSAKFAELSGAIKDVIKSSPSDPKDVGMAAYQILSSGISDTKLATDALNASMKLSLAGLGTTEEATNLVTSALNSFKSEGLTADAAAQTLFGTIQSGKTTTADLANGFGQVAPMAATVGIKFSELMSATAAMTSLGSPASTVFAQMRAAMQAILSPTEEASKAATKFGIDLSAAHMKAVGFPAFLEEVKAATGGDAAKLGEMFSGEALGAMVSLTTVARDAFQSNVTGLVAAGETLDERAKQVSETLSNRFKTMKNNLMVAGSDVGNKVVSAAFAWWEDHGPAVMAVVDQLKDGFKALFSGFTQGTGPVSGFGATMTAIGVQARFVVEAIRAAWPKIREVFSSFVDWFSSEILPRYILYLTGVKTAIEGVVAFVKAHWPQIQEVLQSAWLAIQSILAALLAYFDATMDMLRQTWEDWGDEIMAVVEFLFDHLVPMIQLGFKFIKDVFDTFAALLSGDWGAAWDGLKAILGDAWGSIKLIVSTAIDGIVELVRGIGPAIGRVASGAFDSVRDAFTSAINWIIGKWNGLSFTIPNPFGADWSIGTPNIPYLAAGGTILSSGVAMVGERGPERVFLPQGARVEPLGPGAGAGGGGMTVTVNMPPGSNGDDVVRALRAYQRRNGSVPITTSAVR